MRPTFALASKIMNPSPYTAKILSIEALDKGKWIQTRKINYQDPKGNERVWEMVVRTTRTDTTNVDAVCVLGILKYPKASNELVLIKQFRPPVGKVVIELPAGLIDPKESIESTAIRELLEETGYHGKFISQSPVVYSDPGLANANMSLATVHIDMEDPANKAPKPQLEDGEFIDTFTLPLDNLVDDLVKMSETEACVIDSKLYHFATGLKVAKSL